MSEELELSASPSQEEQRAMGDAGRSLFAEVTNLKAEVAALRSNVGQLCTAVRGLVTFMSVLDQKVDAALRGGPGADFGVL
jgi:hypothetical protein